MLREDLSKEYYAILNVVSNYDGWLLIVKGWSVTLSLAALGLGALWMRYAARGFRERWDALIEDAKRQGVMS